jgi:hypothetical protein
LSRLGGASARPGLAGGDRMMPVRVVDTGEEVD